MGHTFSPLGQEARGPSFVIYRWWCGGPYLAYELVPDATIVEGSMSDTVEKVEARLPDHVSVFLFHLNCTLTARFPKCRAKLVERLSTSGVRILNENVTDISKSKVQDTCRALGLPSTLAPCEGDQDELIIVKTNSNVAGDSEYQLTDQDRSVLGLGRPVPFIRYSSDYKVMRRKDVDPSWWSDDSLICERFITNVGQRWYRAYKFLSQLVLCEFTSNELIKKVRNSKPNGLWFAESDPNGWTVLKGDGKSDRMLDDVFRFTEVFNLNFGTVDVMVDSAEVPHIVDVNSTPAYKHPVAGLVPHLQLALQTCF